MLVVTGLFRLDEKDAAAAKAAAAEMVAETEKEAGCLSYRFYEDISQPGLFRVYEEWESEADLKAHFETPHMAKFRAALSTLSLQSRHVKAFDASNIRDL